MNDWAKGIEAAIKRATEALLQVKNIVGAPIIKGFPSKQLILNDNLDVLRLKNGELDSRYYTEAEVDAMVSIVSGSSAPSALTVDLAAIEALPGPGILVKTSTDPAVAAWANRSLMEGAGISITNPAGIAGDPSIACTITQYTDTLAVAAIKADVAWKAANWDTAYGWGNHAGLYDAVGAASSAVGTHESTYNHGNYNTAYGWGNHASAGYLTSQVSHADVLVDGDFTSQGIMLRGADAGSYSILTDNSADWNTAVGWGNHASAGYLTSQVSHADVVVDGDFTSQGIILRGADAGTYSILTDASANWNTAYGWGNHASAGYLTAMANHGVTTGTIPQSNGTNAWVDSILSIVSGTIVASMSDTHSGDLRINANYASGLTVQTFAEAPTADNGYVAIIRGRGTKASPTACKTGDVLGVYDFQGYGSPTTPTSGASISAIAVADFGNAPGRGSPADLVFSTTDLDLAGPSEAVRILHNKSIKLASIPAATSDLDKFCVSDSGILKFRTGVEVLSDIGAEASGTAATAVAGTYEDITSSCTLTGWDATPTAQVYGKKIGSFRMLTVYVTGTANGTNVKIEVPTAYRRYDPYNDHGPVWCRVFDNGSAKAGYATMSGTEILVAADIAGSLFTDDSSTRNISLTICYETY